MQSFRESCCIVYAAIIILFVIQLQPDLSSESCVILGQGNVALDIARLLLMPLQELAVSLLQYIHINV